jgi:hypothetical protein
MHRSENFPAEQTRQKRARWQQNSPSAWRVATKLAKRMARCQQNSPNAWRVATKLANRTTDNSAWWQSFCDAAWHHPSSSMFICSLAPRQERSSGDIAGPPKRPRSSTRSSSDDLGPVGGLYWPRPTFRRGVKRYAPRGLGAPLHSLAVATLERSPMAHWLWLVPRWPAWQAWLLFAPQSGRFRRQGLSRS